MKALTVFYDSNCGICSRLRRWLATEPAHVHLELLPYDCQEAERRCPGLRARGADHELIVMSDDGRLWQGAEAWVTCLWALKRWRKWSLRLAKPALLPLARQMCHLISSNRLTLSKLAGVKGDAVLAQEILDADPGHQALSGAIEKVVQTRREGREP